MTDLKKTCDVCGQKDFYAGVASSSLGAFSNAFCTICLQMGAETEGMVRATVECCGGLDKVSKHAGLTYFDKEKDSYIDFRTGEIIPVVFKDGTEFKTRSECVKELVKREKIQK